MEWLVAHGLFNDCMFVVQDHCVVFVTKGSGEDILSCSESYIKQLNQQEKGKFYTTTTFTPAFTSTFIPETKQLETVATSAIEPCWGYQKEYLNCVPEVKRFIYTPTVRRCLYD